MRIIILLLFTVFTLAGFSQETPKVKYGKVTAADLGRRMYEIDTTANAVVLYEAGISKIKGNRKGWFSLEFKIHRRIHILNKNGYSHASMEIPLYTSGDNEEELDDLKGVTFNLENGKVVESRLEKSNVFKERKNKNLVIKKFTLPDVREGSILEYEFSITSDFLFNLQPWDFQRDIPRLWSEYVVALPQFLNYILIGQGSLRYYLKDQKDKFGDYVVEQRAEGAYGSAGGTEKVNIRCGITEFRWAMKDIPALREEAYTSSMRNHVAKIEFQLSGYQAPLVEEKVMTNWQDLAGRLLKREDFGMQLENTGQWLPEVIRPILQNAMTDLEKARKLHSYVRDNITCTDHSQLYTDQSLKAVFKNNHGGVAEINLLLIAMLRSAGISADPVILSTRANGYVHASYPVISKFNYVIARAIVNGQELLLDASQPKLGFAKLSADCYNGQARVINATATELKMVSNQLTENETATVNIINDNNGGQTASIHHVRGYHESTEIRMKIKTQGEEAFFKGIANGQNDISTGKGSLDSLDNYEAPVVVKYDMKFKNQGENILYVTPVLIERYEHNPFKSANRQYPVEMPYKTNEVYTLKMAVPEGYKMEELPNSLTLKMNAEGDVLYEYKIDHSAGFVNLYSRLQINKTGFQPSEYDTLREFFNRVVAKQNEQIVFKKK